MRNLHYHRHSIRMTISRDTNRIDRLLPAHRSAEHRLPLICEAVQINETASSVHFYPRSQPSQASKPRDSSMKDIATLTKVKVAMSYQDQAKLKSSSNDADYFGTLQNYICNL
jgi:hypothetical protein